MLKPLAGIVVLVLLIGTPAFAAFDAVMQQVGPNVVVTGSGSLDVSDLSIAIMGASEDGSIFPALAAIRLGPSGAALVSTHVGSITGPSSIGSGTQTFVSAGTGDRVGVDGYVPRLLLPVGYVSGSALSTASTYTGQTLASLGVLPGTYVWSWGSGGTADSFTLNIMAPPQVPSLSPPALGLILLLLGGLGARLGVTRQQS